jgi:hypothetical protein
VVAKAWAFVGFGGGLALFFLAFFLTMSIADLF